MRGVTPRNEGVGGCEGEYALKHISYSCKPPVSILGRFVTGNTVRVFHPEVYLRAVLTDGVRFIADG